jgi:pyruvate dehydrogenase E2 component (dihydrolipoamide acetyltransferase)
LIDVRIPKGGMSTVEVDVVAVNVAPGDAVESGAVLIEVESEKATFEVECGATGIVREVLVRVGDVMNVGDVVARIEPVPNGSPV